MKKEFELVQRDRDLNALMLWLGLGLGFIAGALTVLASVYGKCGGF